jgi:hypothetical protein
MRFQRNTGVHQRERTAADRRHRRRAIRLENVGHDADRVREIRFARQHRLQRAAREIAVADLTSGRTPEELHFTDRERREVVVEHEPLERLSLEVLDLLRFLRSAERDRDEGLGLTAGEHR